MPKILVLRFSSIGDIVLTSPIIRCLRNQVSGVEIHYLTKQSFTSILNTNSCIDKVFGFQKKLAEVIPELKKENYDFVIDLHNNIRSKQVTWALKKPHKSFPKLNLKKWMLVNFKINKMPALHIVDRYFKAASHFKIKNDNKGLDFFIPEKDEVHLLAQHDNLKQKYVAVVVGAQHFTKRLPNHKIIELCKKIPFPIVIIGGKEDVENASIIAKELKSNVINATGKYNLFQSASIIKQAEVVITNDTGMMHIAAAFRKKIISVWGNTVPEFGMYPYMPGNEENYKIAEIKNLSCRPCSKIGKTSCPKEHFKCMNEIDVDVISKQVMAYIS